MEEGTYVPLYLRGIDQFNRGQYFASHESWEELWIGQCGPARQFYKGLIQAAVALLHFQNRNVHGARKLLAGSSGLLDAYRPKYLGLDVDQFLAEMQRSLAPLAGPEPPAVPPPFDPALVPQIRLDPAPPSAAEASYP